MISLALAKRIAAEVLGDVLANAYGRSLEEAVEELMEDLEMTAENAPQFPQQHFMARLVHWWEKGYAASSPTTSRFSQLLVIVWLESKF